MNGNWIVFIYEALLELENIGISLYLYLTVER